MCASARMMHITGAVFKLVQMMRGENVAPTLVQGSHGVKHGGYNRNELLESLHLVAKVMVVLSSRYDKKLTETTRS